MKDFYNHIDVDKQEYKPFDENKDLRRSLQEFDTGVEAVQVIKKNIDTERAMPQKIISRMR